MTSLNLHAHCRDPLSPDSSPSGCFWDTGVSAAAFHGGDHWSRSATSEEYAWTELSTGHPPYCDLNQLVESSAP